MMYLVGQFRLWIILALVIGLVTGFIAARRRPGFDRADGLFWFGIYVVLLIAGAILAFTKGLKGSPGLWLETLLLMTAAWLVGCLIGALLKALFGGQGREELATAVAAGTAAGGLPAPAAVASPLPPPAPRLPDEDAHAGRRPPGFSGAIGGKPDDLKLVSGIGKQNEHRLNELGIWHFSQIASWSKENVDWVGSYLAFPGRIEREHWVEQAGKLAGGEMTEFAQRAARGDVPTSRNS